MTLTVSALLAAATVSAEEGLHPLMIGQEIPDLKLKNVGGEAVGLRAAAKEQPLVLIFYRGSWCPYCSLHLGQLQEIDPQLREMGYRIMAISPDLPANLKTSVEKGELTYTLLSDSTMAAAKAFGLAFTVDDATLAKYEEYGINLETASGEKHHMLPVPAVFLIGQDGIIDFVYANPDYKTRIDSEVLLAAAKAALKTAP
jgi:peroxiredoxin